MSCYIGCSNRKRRRRKVLVDLEDFNYTIKLNISGNKDRWYGAVIQDDFEGAEHEDAVVHKTYAIYTLLHLAGSISTPALQVVDDITEPTHIRFDNFLLWFTLQAICDRMHKYLDSLNDGMFIENGMMEILDQCFIGIVDEPEEEDEDEDEDWEL